MISPDYPDQHPPSQHRRQAGLGACPGAADLGLDRPSAARVYDFLLGGGSNFALDRQAGQDILDAAPDSARTARANRAFLGRVVRHLVTSGITQILDLGSGLPTAGNVHTIAHQTNPHVRVIYVDRDPVAVTHAQQLVAGNPMVGVIHADLRTPAAVLGDPIAQAHLDFTQPVAILMISVLHFVEGDLTDLIGAYRRNMVPGSMLGVSHATPPDDTTHQRVAARRVTEVYAQTPTPIQLRDRAAILHLFNGFDLLEPGLVPVEQWRPTDPAHRVRSAEAGAILGGLGQLPSAPPARALTTGQGKHGSQRPMSPDTTIDDRGLGSPVFPKALHICCYDVRGTFLDTDRMRRTRETGLVAHTHHLLEGLARQHPTTQIAITVTGAVEPQHVQRLRTPEGHRVNLRTIATAFPRHLRSADTRGKDAALVRHFYEDTIDDPNNPIWRSLARQYAQAIQDAAMPDLLLQNTNPLVSVLKAEDYGLIDGSLLNALRLTGVIHDTTDLACRFGYLARRMEHTHLRVRLVAVSHAVCRALVDHGIAPDLVRTVFNGLDVHGFEQRLERARATGAFERVCERNRLPAGKRVLVSARRVPWKGHEDVIAAAGLMEQRGELGDVQVVFNGAGMIDTRWADYEYHLAHQIQAHGLSHRVFLLDELTPDEVASCYLGAAVEVGASREPEPFGYSNIEAMLAGVPTIATRHGGPLEYIEDGVSGLLVPPASPGAIADAIHVLLSDEDLRSRIARAGQASARRFTLQSMFNGYAAVLAA